MNMSLQATVAANELVIAIRDAAGNAPSTTTPVKIPFRDSTAATGTPVFRDVTSAITTTVSSGSTLGSVNAVPNWVYVYALDNGGTVELAFSASNKWDEGTLQNTTADGGGGSADASDVLYSNNARTAKAIRLIGRVKSTQATAGTWATAPSEVSIVPFKDLNGWRLYDLLPAATVTNPTKGTTSWDRASWRVVGDSIEIRWHYGQSAAGTSGSGDYLIPLPAGYSLDLTKLKDSGSTLGNHVGTAIVNGATIQVGYVHVYDATRLIFHDTAAGTWDSSGVNNFGITTLEVSINTFPMPLA
jgi:hypothetical protein